jgi:hypothetical protein
MARLVSNIGAEQRKQTANARKAVLYRDMAAALTMGAPNLIASFPKYVPRGHTPAWYLKRAEKSEQASAAAGELADLLTDMEKRNSLERITPAEIWRVLTGDERFPDSPGLAKGLLDTLAFWVDYIGEDLPYFVPKLSTEQRQWCQQFIRAKMEDLIEAFDSSGR